MGNFVHHWWHRIIENRTGQTLQVVEWSPMPPKRKIGRHIKMFFCLCYIFFNQLFNPRNFRVPREVRLIAVAIETFLFKDGLDTFLVSWIYLSKQMRIVLFWRLFVFSKMLCYFCTDLTGWTLFLCFSSPWENNTNGMMINIKVKKYFIMVPFIN